MNSDTIWDQLRLFRDIVAKVEHLLCQHDVDTEIVKAKLTLRDGSSLRVSESFVDGRLVSCLSIKKRPRMDYHPGPFLFKGCA